MDQLDVVKSWKLMEKRLLFRYVGLDIASFTIYCFLVKFPLNAYFIVILSRFLKEHLELTINSPLFSSLGRYIKSVVDEKNAFCSFY